MVAAEEREVIASAVTPSGIELAYGVKPKRFYTVNGVDVPSVTQILGVLDKSAALTWWGMKTGILGMIELYQEKAIHGGDHLFDTKDGKALTPERAVELLTEHKKTVNHLRDRAGDRGLAVHDAFETWCVTGNKPDPSIFPDEERGYVEGLNAFLDDVNPEPYAAEVMVGSVEHGFAGRYDARIRIPKECQVVYHRTPARGPKYATLKQGVLLADLKTSKGTYMESHGRQLEAYELASVECGYDPTTARGILHVNAEGGYELVRSICTAQDFLDVLAVWRGNERIKGRR